MCQIFFVFTRGDIPKGEEILEQEDIVKLKRCIYSAQVGSGIKGEKRFLSCFQ